MSLFDTGTILFTPKLLRLAGEHKSFSEFIMKSLARHKMNESDSCKDDQEQNKAAVITGGRIFSSYKIPPDLSEVTVSDKVWVITEAEDNDGQRHSTTLLWPSEY